MNHNQLIKLIVTCLFLSFCTPSSSSVLRKAINSQDVPKVKGLVRNGANVNSKDQDLGWNALMTASDLGNLELVEFLLESKAEVNALDHNGATALIIACMNGHLLIVDKLISAKANLDIVDNKGYSALMYSVLYGYKYIYELLIISNANTELKSKDLKTARVLLKEKMGLIKLETNRSIKDSPPIPIIEINLKKFFPEEAKKANIYK
jgi:ankyrin repeat protein